MNVIFPTKKNITIAGAVVMLLLVGIGLFLINRPGANTIPYTLEGKKVHLLVADSDDEREKGLMYYRELKGADGMIFYFPKSDIQYFWNKNTYMDLDVYWLQDDKVIGKDFLPSIEKSKTVVTIDSPKPANAVIEIPR